MIKNICFGLLKTSNLKSRIFYITLIDCLLSSSFCAVFPDVDLITKFARLEFQYGNTERAKSMFDKVLGTYSKRTDLWSVFIDLMVKHGSQKEVR